MKLAASYCLDRIAGQPVLLPQGSAIVDGGKIYALNETGAWIMEALRQETDEQTLLRRAAEHFLPQTQAERDTLNADVRAFCDTLREMRLLEE